MDEEIREEEKEILVFRTEKGERVANASSLLFGETSGREAQGEEVEVRKRVSAWLSPTLICSEQGPCAEVETLVEFDVREDVRLTAAWSCGLTLFVMFVLGVGAMVIR